MVRRAIMFFLLAFAVFACAAVMFACGGECDHANVTRQVEREATCTTEGEVKYTCEDCGDVAWKRWTRSATTSTKAR